VKEVKRIPVTLDHLHIVFHYGVIKGIDLLIGQMNYTDEERERAFREVYEKNMKPTADYVRAILGEENAIAFDYRTMEFVVLDKKADEVNFDNRNDIEQSEPKEESDGTLPR